MKLSTQHQCYSLPPISQSHFEMYLHTHTPSTNHDFPKRESSSPSSTPQTASYSLQQHQLNQQVKPMIISHMQIHSFHPLNCPPPTIQITCTGHAGNNYHNTKTTHTNATHPSQYITHNSHNRHDPINASKPQHTAKKREK